MAPDPDPFKIAEGRLGDAGIPPRWVAALRTKAPMLDELDREVLAIHGRVIEGDHVNTRELRRELKRAADGKQHRAVLRVLVEECESGRQSISGTITEMLSAVSDVKKAANGNRAVPVGAPVVMPIPEESPDAGILESLAGQERKF